jgi:hypothetical protein
VYLAKRNGRNRFELAPHLRLAGREAGVIAPVKQRGSANL